jgi:hypothetical protein
MAKPKEPINPFYVLSAVVGVAFTITACAYLVLMWRTNEGKSLASDAAGVHPLMNLLDQHGLVILLVEVLLIGIVSIAAIVLDHFRGKRLAREKEREQGSKGEGETS